MVKAGWRCFSSCLIGKLKSGESPRPQGPKKQLVRHHHPAKALNNFNRGVSDDDRGQQTNTAQLTRIKAICMFQSRLLIASNQPLGSLASCTRSSVGFLSTLAHRRSFDPTKTGSSVFRISQVARHLSAAPSSQQPSTHTTMAPTYTTRHVGAPHTLDYRIFIEKDGVPVSPFHDIPLYANEQQTILNMVVEVPRWTNAKQEVR